jgi:hypothetical protein
MIAVKVPWNWLVGEGDPLPNAAQLIHPSDPDTFYWADWINWTKLCVEAAQYS